MNHKYIKVVPYIFSGSLFLPHFVFAQTITDQQRCDNFKAQFNGIYSMVPNYYCTANGTALQLINLVFVSAGAIAVVFLILGGFWYITSAGNEEQSEKGKKIMINAGIGLAVIVMAIAIVQVVTNILTSGK